MVDSFFQGVDIEFLNAFVSDGFLKKSYFSQSDFAIVGDRNIIFRQRPVKTETLPKDKSMSKRANVSIGVEE